jgi:Family of unknown function (DUF5701)
LNELGPFPGSKVSAVATVARVLPALPDQAERLISLGVHELAGLRAADVRVMADVDADEAVLAVRADLVPASVLRPLLRIDRREAFVVVDMTDLESFGAIGTVGVPDSPLYLLRRPERGDEMANWSPDEGAAGDRGRRGPGPVEGRCARSRGPAGYDPAWQRPGS